MQSLAFGRWDIVIGSLLTAFFVLVVVAGFHAATTQSGLRPTEAGPTEMIVGAVVSATLFLVVIGVILASLTARRIAWRDCFGLTRLGPGAVLVRALPAALGAPDPAPLLRDIADELAESGESTALAARLDAVMARMACHGSIRAGRRLSLAEMDALLRAMEATPRAATCSHGRPTFLKLTRADIERLFQRS